MQESQIDTSTAERQLLYDIRSESRKTNELLSQLLEVLRPIARDTVPKEEVKLVKPRATKPKSSISRTDKPKRGKNNVNNK